LYVGGGEDEDAVERPVVERFRSASARASFSLSAERKILERREGMVVV